MKTMVKGLALALCLSCFVVAGCNTGAQTNKPESQKTPVTEQKPGKPVDKAPGTVERIIYVVPTDGSQYLVAAKEKVQGAAQENKELLEALLKKNAGNIPTGTKLLGVDVKDGIATVNLSREFLQKGQGEYAQTMLIYAVVNTLTESKDIKKVQFKADGKVVDVLGQMDLSTPLERNTSYLPKK